MTKKTKDPEEEGDEEEDKGRKHDKKVTDDEKDNYNTAGTVKNIPDICHFFYTGKICWLKILHPKARILRKIAFRDKIA